MADTRNKKSVSALKKAAYKLLDTKPFSSITVRELCEEAGLNRSTFYSNYENIDYFRADLYRDIYEELDSINERFGNPYLGSTHENQLGLIKAITTYYRDNNDRIMKVTESLSDFHFFNKMAEYFLEKHEILREHYVDLYTFLFCMIGIFYTIHHWIDGDFPISEDELAHILFFSDKRPYDAKKYDDYNCR